MDISPESVEIAQLSLWIRTARPSQPLTDLSAHIRCGNSVVDDQNVDTRAFDWSAQYPRVFERGGFDAVVGNPPYIRQERFASTKGYLEARYKSFDSSADLYVYFYERSINILRDGGRLAFISSGTFVKGAFGTGLRNFLSDSCHLDRLIDFGEYQPFPGAEMVHPTCFVFQKTKGTETHSRMLRFLGKGIPPKDLSKAIEESGIEVQAPTNQRGDWHLQNEPVLVLLARLLNGRRGLKEYCGGKILYGVKTSLNDAFVVDTEKRDLIVGREPQSEQLFKHLMEGTHLRPWYQEDSDQWLIVIPNGWTRKNGQFSSEHEAWTWFQTQFPMLVEHLSVYACAAGRRLDKGEYWWELRPCDYYEAFLSPKIVWPDIAKLPRFSIDSLGHFLGTTAFFIPSADYFLLGVLNSWVSWYVVSKTAQPLRLRAGRWQYRCKRQYMETLPVPDGTTAEKQAIASLSEELSRLARTRFELLTKVSHRLTSTFREKKEARVSQKLAQWHALSFQELGAELRKSLKLGESPWVDPALADRWEPYLSESRELHSELTARISRGEAELNQRVYKLFNLSREEIKLLEAEVAS